MLRFYGYYKESVVESAIENWRMRRVVIYYYLEDDSIHVAEPKQDNSGLPQVGAATKKQSRRASVGHARCMARAVQRRVCWAGC